MCECTTPPQPQYFGQLHNEAMEYVYNDFNDMPRVDVITPFYQTQIITTMFGSLKKFFLYNLPKGADQCFSMAQSQAEIFSKVVRQTDDSGDIDIQPYIDYVFENLYFSPASTPYVNQLQSAMNSDLSPQDYQNALTGIYNDVIADKNIPNREFEQLTTMLQIGIYSSQYWSNSDVIAKWSKLFTNSGRTPTQWNKIGTADAAGAVGGGARALIVGLCGGPVGWGIFAGNVLGGAACASIVAWFL